MTLVFCQRSLFSPLFERTEVIEKGFEERQSGEYVFSWTLFHQLPVCSEILKDRVHNLSRVLSKADADGRQC